MAYQTLSIVVADMEIDANALDAAVALASQTDAHLDIICAAIDPARYDPMPIGSAAVMMETSVRETQKHANEIEKAVLAHINTSALKFATQPVVVPQMGLDSVIARLTRYSDLVIATKPYGSVKSPLHVNILEAELFGSGSPVLVIPSDYQLPENAFGRVAIAWNESDEALATIRAGLPMLKDADKVDIILIDPSRHSAERSDPGGAISMMLVRHGVKTNVAVLARTMPKIADVLTRFVTEHDVDLIVMGAYGHSRFRESILGGATRDMLEGAQVPLFMAH